MLEQDITELINLLEKVGKDTLLKKSSDILDYKQKRDEYNARIIRAKVRLVESGIRELSSWVDVKDYSKLVEEAEKLKQLVSGNEIKEASLTASRILDILEGLPKKPQEFRINVKLPNEIKQEVEADLNEAKNCFRNGLYRSCIILCGRILEIALHRKYYEITNNDLLEKAPGIGLGNLVARLSECDVKIDPAIMQQIHLINQVRVFSVHKKQEPFKPTKEQTQAIMLYTLDIVNRLW